MESAENAGDHVVRILVLMLRSRVIPIIWVPMRNVGSYVSATYPRTHFIDIYYFIVRKLRTQQLLAPVLSAGLWV